MQNRLKVVLIAAVIVVPSLGFSQDGRPIVGTDIGVMVPLDPLDDFVEPGGVLSPFAGYMFNDYIGIMTAAAGGAVSRRHETNLSG